MQQGKAVLYLDEAHIFLSLPRNSIVVTLLASDRTTSIEQSQFPTSTLRTANTDLQPL